MTLLQRGAHCAYKLRLLVWVIASILSWGVQVAPAQTTTSGNGSSNINCGAGCTITNNFGGLINGTTTTFDFTASGSIAKGTMVSLVSANTVSQGLGLGLGALASVGNTASPTMAALDSTHFVEVYNDSNNASRLTAVVGTISGSAATFGTPVLVPSNSGVGSTTANLGATGVQTSIVALSSSLFTLILTDSTNGSKLTNVVGSVSGTTITFGTQVLVASSSGAGSTNGGFVQDLDGSTYVIGYLDSTNSNKVTGVVASVSGTTITMGTQVVAVVPSQNVQGLVVMSSTLFVLMTGSNGNALTSIAGSISGTTITYGSTTSLVTNFSTMSFAPRPLDSTHFVASFFDNTVTPAQQRAVVASLSGTAITAGTVVSYPSLSGQPVTSSPVAGNLQAMDATHFIAFYNDPTNGNKETSTAASISGTAITFGTPVLVGYGSISQTYQTIRIDSTHFAVYFFDSGVGASTAQVIAGGLSGTIVTYGIKDGVNFPITSTSSGILPFPVSSTQFLVRDFSQNLFVATVNGISNPIGVASAAATNGQTVTIILNGVAKGVFSGLTAGLAYYSQGDGTVSTIPSTTPVGIALNTTDMLISNNIHQ